MLTRRGLLKSALAVAAVTASGIALPSAKALEALTPVEEPKKYFPLARADDTAYLQRLINDAARKGTVAQIPPGDYTVRGHLFIHGKVHSAAAGITTKDAGNVMVRHDPYVSYRGTTLHIDGNSLPLSRSAVMYEFDDRGVRQLNHDVIYRHRQVGPIDVFAAPTDLPVRWKEAHHAPIMGRITKTPWEAYPKLTWRPASYEADE